MPPTRAKRVGIWHMGINLTVVIHYAANLWWRHDLALQTGQFLLSLAGVLLLAVSGWLGGEMVYVHGVAVDPVGEQPARK